MGKWLNQLRQAEEFSKTAPTPADKTAKTSVSGVLSVLAAPPPGVLRNFSNDPNPAPPEWAERFASLDPSRPPVGFPAQRWRETIRDGELFLAKWARQAADLGWTALDVLGAHRTAPAANYAPMGLVLLIRGGRVVALSAETAIMEQASGSRLTFTRRPTERDAALLWDLKHA